MDVDPLQDTVPPRYAIESDDEDEAPSTTSKPVAVEPIDIEIKGTVEPGAPLVVASGSVSSIWAKGASLGEQIAGIFVNKIQVGLVFQPTWTRATVVVSEAFTRLPLRFMHPYAVRIIDAFQPSAISILDSYTASTYTSSTPVRITDAPLRYLSTAASSLSLPIPLFEPPNLLQSTTASFLSLSSLPSQAKAEGRACTAVLVPTAHIPHPPPRSLTAQNVFSPSSSHLDELDNSVLDWNLALIKEAHGLLFQVVREEETGAWDVGREGTRGAEALGGGQRKRLTEVGEGAMYL